MIKKINILHAFLLLATILNPHKMHSMEQPNKEQEESFAFTELLPEMQYYFTKLLAQSSIATTVEEAGKIINALTQTNKEFLELINNPLFCLRVIKSLAQQFACSDQQAAEALQTKEAKHRLEIQKQFLILCQQENFNEQEFNLLYEQHKAYVDLNFTFYIVNPEQKKLEITLLIQAAIQNNCPAIQTILKHGADINKATSSGETALIYMSTLQYTEAIQCLLNSTHIAIDQQDTDGWTALMFAAENNECPIIRLLLSHGADINKADNHGFTALMLAVANEHMEAIQCLLNNPHPRIAINQQNIYGITPLIIAAEKNNCPIINILLNHGADINKSNKRGFTPLIYATAHGSTDAVQCLLNNPHIVIDQQNKYGVTALIEAIQTENMVIIQHLLEAGADPEIATFEGLTPLHAAQETGDQEIIDLILSAIQKT